MSFAFAATARKNSSVSSASKPGDRHRRELGVEAAERAPGDIDRALGERLVHRHHRVAVAADPGAVAERLRRAPGRARCRRPRPCGGRRSRGRRWPRRPARVGRGGRAARACGRRSRSRSRARPRRRRGRARRVISVSRVRALDRRRSARAHRLGPRGRRLAVHRKALGRGPARRRGAPILAPPRSRWRRPSVRRMNAPGPSGPPKRAAPPVGQHVVGARGVVAEGGRPRRSRRTRRPRPGCGRWPRRRPSNASWRCSGASASASSSARCEAGRRDQRQRRVGDRRALGGELGRPARPRRRAGRRRGRPAASGLSSPCSAWAQRSSAIACGGAVPSATITSSLGPAIPSIPTAPETCALRLGHVAVARADDDVDGVDRVGSVGERGDRLRAADRVDLLDPASAQAASTASLGRPSPPGGVTTTTRETPAARAGRQHISTDDG